MNLTKLDKIINMTNCFIAQEGHYDEVAIDNQIRILFSMFQEEITDENFIYVKRHIHSIHAIKINKGISIQSYTHKPWLMNEKSKIKFRYWKTYKSYIEEIGFTSPIINILDDNTDEIIDMLGNPNAKGDFSRKGLIIGDVQSGKTTTYTALINKASDVGYKVIIVLAGSLEKLRKQTQQRLDEGFVGRKSAERTMSENSKVGVGLRRKDFGANSLTSTISDFKNSAGISMSLNSASEPTIFVVKKNKSILTRLEKWLRVHNAIDGKISLPLLFIDDEADNASVNTGKPENDPTAINKGIRNILKLFSKSSYVGITATPYANIFINPDSDDDMLKEDLFPKDYIYLLNPPSNYVGAKSIFSEEATHSHMLKEINDCEAYIPIKHKTDFNVEEIPESMKDAIASFFIINTIRDLRKDNNKHRTMLINASVKIKVQKSIAQVVNMFLKDMQTEVENYYLMGETAMRYDSFQRLKRVYEEHFHPLKNLDFPNENMEFNWDQIQKNLHKAVAGISIRVANSGTTKKDFNYEDNDCGLRIIAIGGYALSRGITLEGLVVSYIYRNTKMYDTLMQMGRWFGYRTNYESLCQIWMSEDAIEWYGDISSATEDLKLQISRMNSLNKTPMDFGLAVRSDNLFLTVTAINKMRYATEFECTISFQSKVVETPNFYDSKNKNLENYKKLQFWIKELFEAGYRFQNPKNFIKDVSKNDILDLLNTYDSHFANVNFNTEQLYEYIDKSKNQILDKWDVVVASGNGGEVDILDYKFKTVERAFSYKKENKYIKLFRSRLGTVDISKTGLSELQLKEIESNNTSGKTLPEKAYFEEGIKRNPLLVIYLVKLKNKPDKNGLLDPEKERISKNLKVPFVGMSIGIPYLGRSESEEKVRCIYNVQRCNEEFGLTQEDDQEDDLEDEELDI